MAVTWIILSTRWSLSSVQASLNVIISLLGTTGLWAFSRYWWQRGSINVLSDRSVVPLARLLTIAGPGEAWDVTTTLGRQLFARHNWHLLVQSIVVIGVTLACALAGPIAKVSLKTGVTIVQTELQVLQSVKGGGFFGNLLYANVLWNDTAQSLDDAAFPTDQLLEFLPSTTTSPWAYVAEEWDATWKVSCNYTERIYLQNLTGSGEHNIFDPVNAFPAYRDTYDPTWLDSRNYRISSDFDSWQDWSQNNQMQEAVIYVLIQSDPEKDDRMRHNNETLYLSLSVLHAKNFRVLYEDMSGVGGEETWRPIGPVENASYARAQCAISRKPQVEDENKIPWPWTNDTNSIITSYRTYYFGPFAEAAVKKLPVEPPSASDLFRFYQIYMATMNTFHSDPSQKTLSMKVRTTEISLIFLIALALLSVLTAWNSIRYAIFLRHHKAKIEALYVPDAKIEWMMHAVHSIDFSADLEANHDGKRRKNSERFRTATFGHAGSHSNPFDLRIPFPALTRFKSCPNSSSGIAPDEDSPPPLPSQDQNPSLPTKEEGGGKKHKRKNSENFRIASFDHLRYYFNFSDVHIQFPALAHVKSCSNSTSDVAPDEEFSPTPTPQQNGNPSSSANDDKL